MNRIIFHQLRKPILSTLALGISAAILLTSCGSSSGTTEGEKGGEQTGAKGEERPTAPGKNPGNKKQGTMAADTLRTMSGLSYIVYEEGDKTKPVRPGMTVKVDYAGYLTNGTLFDTSIDSVGAVHSFDRGGYPFEPIEFTVGKGMVIRGWDEGLTSNMFVGGRRRLIIPSDLAYGSRGAGEAIPPDATLIFDIHVLEATE